MNARLPHARSQRGITLIGLVFWAVLISSAALLAMRVIPTVNEYLTIKRVVSRIADSGASSEGLRITPLPPAMAGPSLCATRFNGSL